MPGPISPIARLSPPGPKNHSARHRPSLRRALFAALAVLLAAAGLAVPQSATATSASNPAQVLYEAYPQSATHPTNGPANPRVLDVAINSPSTDAPVKWVRLLLPEGWSKTANRTWPTLWLFHGGGDNHTSYTEKSNIADMVKNKDVIVVMAETSRCSSYLNWWNYGDESQPPDWEDYLIEEVSDILETGYRASDQRSVLGISMGGGGAMALAGKHPGHFKAVASLSGAVDMLYYDWSQDTNHDGKIDLLDSQLDQVQGPSIVKLGALTCSPTYTPLDWKRIAGEPGYPFDTNVQSDIRQRDVWWDNSAIGNAAGLAGTPLYIFFGNGANESEPNNAGSVGPGWTWQGDSTQPVPASRCTSPNWTDRDDALVERGVYNMNQNFLQKLDELSIPATVCSSWGTHTWDYWDREIYAALPMLLQAINVP